MAFPASHIPSATMRDLFNGALGAAVNLGGASPDTFKLALYDNSATATIDTDPSYYGAAAWATEVTGTNWAAGGVALSTNVVSLVSTTGVKFDAADVSVASTTISTAAFGCLIYDTAAGLTHPSVLVAVNFGASYTTNNGTFGITWDALGIFQLTLH